MAITDRPAVTEAETAARGRVTEIRRVLAGDRAARHEGAVAVSSARPAAAETPPAGPVNNHPGPDFCPKQVAA